jgi:sec-independent protein translocase protein TatA
MFGLGRRAPPVPSGAEKEQGMGSFSLWHWLIVILVVMLLFGRGKISELMGDFAKGIKSFKKGMADDEQAENEQIEQKSGVEAPKAYVAGKDGVAKG